MATRALYTFLPTNNVEMPFHVYIHHDGNPRCAVPKIAAALKIAWMLPRYEHDEFAAAFIAANKDGPGHVRLLPAADKWERVAPADIEYRYEIYALGGKLFARGYDVFSKKQKPLFDLPISEALLWAKGQS